MPRASNFARGHPLKWKQPIDWEHSCRALTVLALPYTPPPGLFLDRLMPLCHPNIVNVFSTNIAKRTIVMEKVSRDLQALLEDKGLLKEVSGEKMVG